MRNKDRSLSSSIIIPPTKPKNNPKYWLLFNLFLKISKTKIEVIMGLNVVNITLPAPAKPYCTPKNEETIKAMFRTELPRTYFSAGLFKISGFFRK